MPVLLATSTSRRRSFAMSWLSTKTSCTTHTGHPFPQDPLDQLDAAVLAVFRSWDGDRAKLYRRQEGIPDDLGTAVNVMAMVFGNRGEDSGTGVCFHPRPGKRSSRSLR